MEVLKYYESLLAKIESGDNPVGLFEMLKVHNLVEDLLSGKSCNEVPLELHALSDLYKQKSSQMLEISRNCSESKEARLEAVESIAEDQRILVGKAVKILLKI